MLLLHNCDSHHFIQAQAIFTNVMPKDANICSTNNRWAFKDTS